MEETTFDSWMDEAIDPAAAERRKAIRSVAEAQHFYLRDARAARDWGWLPFIGKRLHVDWARSRHELAHIAARASLIIGALQLQAINEDDLAWLQGEYSLEIARSTPDTDLFPEIIGDGSEDVQ